MDASVFADGNRSDIGPADHGEPHASYLDRSARPEFAAARDRIDDWYRRLCPDMRDGVRARLRSNRNHEFAAGYWELYLHELLTRLGYDLACEPELPSGRRIDFLARRGESSMYVEATVAHSSSHERAADARRNRLYRELQGVETDKFMFGIEIERAGAGDIPNVAALRRRLQDWLASLPPDAGIDDWNAIPRLSWNADGWELVFEALAIRPELRGEPVDRPLGMFMDETGGRIDDETPLRRALERKAPRKYGPLEHPFVVAVCEYSWEHSDTEWHRKNVLYGRSAIAFGDGQPPREIRQPDGFWRGGGNRPQNTRVSALLLAAQLHPWSLDNSLTWWEHPFAENPVPVDLIPEVASRHVLSVRDGQGELGIIDRTMTAASVLGATTA